MPLENKSAGTDGKKKIFKEFFIYALVVLAAVVSATLIRVFVIEPFIVPTPSMEPSLRVGDKVLVNKLSYKFTSVQRGDIIAFHSLIEEKELVKRVIAAPGDEITLTSEGEIYINGEKINEEYLPAGQDFSYINQTVDIEDDEVFVMGDNRKNSLDSRFFGAIPQKDIFGKFIVIYWPPSRW
ncbi:MAG: signal peptidase I [Actinomycetota bacterium]|nr:signal peptidase I [Actinomycetota bacterium]